MRRGFLNKTRDGKALASFGRESDAEKIGESNLTIEETVQVKRPGPSGNSSSTSWVDDPCQSESDVHDPPKSNAPPLDKHRPPQWVLDGHPEGETRLIFCEWPRDPNGQVLMYDKEIPGKTVPNGIPHWGATLYDFYQWQRIPSCAALLSTSSGSRLAATMRAVGELTAETELLAADIEADPEQLVLPLEIARDVQSWEDHVWCDRNDNPADVRFIRSEEHAHAVEVPLPDPSPEAHCDITEIAPENYPGPWPLVPFSAPTPPKLETLIPYTLLPHTLIVHDPWKLLSMPHELDADAGTDWADMPDNTYTYKLAPLTTAGLRKLEHQHKVFNSGIDDHDFVVTTVPNQDGTCPPWIEINAPPSPRKKVTTPAAHLYLSPSSKAGDGNHSVVYHAEWELPRSLIVPDIFCQACVAEESAEMHASGELIIADALARAGEEPDACGHILNELSVKPETLVDISCRREKGQKDPEIAPDIRTVAPRVVESAHTYDGPIVQIRSKIAWQTPGRGNNCAHIGRRRLSKGVHHRPPTARVRVCAKLSHQYDEHLEREAKVYQALPSHLSEHWSGYNVIHPSREPVPVGAVVPQFYGYYVPSAGARIQAKGAYLSAVMVLENCGVPLDPAVLSPDEKKECWSLLYRLHHAGWTHESVATRNIMMQPGPMTSPQGWMRGTQATSFRVIDFGRSLYCGTEEERSDTKKQQYKGGAEEKGDASEDVYRELRAEPELHSSRLTEKIRREKVLVDELLAHGMYDNHVF
ncbi:hypothetical protein DFH07DRAFT_965689 [Mycena maculata]|uniref:Protein kinase domain-containing protein n=1 Tax=Mycena maculata TaxID=230809 RepID=A0AAD7IE39_9AGAR|nr:hypothetical protein DFH07DRAFT_965689 [Mycena maculata]